ncbi:MAG: hypothetical protein IJV14_12985 [Lachnospiraceae bacterium]|nr:hypothetical protein [Lachnospiraceae bacterium]
MSERGGSIRCSFCSKPMGLVGKLIAGNGSYICNECVLMCMEICYPQVDLSPAKGGDPKADSPAGASGTASGAAPATPKGATETAPAQPGPENGTSVMKEDFLLFAKKLEPLVNLSNPGTGEITDARKAILALNTKIKGHGEIDNDTKRQIRTALCQDIRGIADRLKAQGKNQAAKDLLMETHNAMLDLPKLAAELRAVIRRIDA